MVPARAWLALLSVALLLAGCVGSPSDVAPAATIAPAPDALGPVEVELANVMEFTRSVVSPAVGVSNDLYEPTMEVSDTGTIYVAAHVIGAATTGTPAYFSRDQGKTWAPLPFFQNVAAPSPIQGSQPPPGDEGFIVAGDHGQAWMADIYAAGFSITGWCDNGGSQCYDNRQAYDRVESTTTCTPGSLNDRPWAAYANGTLLVVNNAGGGPMQIGVLKVPPPAPVGLVGVNGPTWNMCASEGGSIPGIPAMRKDLTFAVPQMFGDGEKTVLNVVVGNAKDISKTKVHTVFPVTSKGAGTTNGGRTAFDRNGTLYVGARNNTAERGGFILATSTDGGETYTVVNFTASTQLRSLYLDGNMAGPGALLTWSQAGTDKTKSDWYVAHVYLDENGAPKIADATLAIDEGPNYSAHVMGAAAGPDGRAYFIVFEQPKDGGQYAGSTPLAVWIQQSGTTLPVTEPVGAAKAS